MNKKQLDLIAKLITDEIETLEEQRSEIERDVPEDLAGYDVYLAELNYTLAAVETLLDIANTADSEPQTN